MRVSHILMNSQTLKSCQALSSWQFNHWRCHCYISVDISGVEVLRDSSEMWPTAVVCESQLQMLSFCMFCGWNICVCGDQTWSMYLLRGGCDRQRSDAGAVKCWLQGSCERWHSVKDTTYNAVKDTFNVRVL